MVGSVPLLDDTHRFDGKVDHRFSERSTGFLRYGLTHASVNQGSLLGAAGAPLEAGLRTMTAVGSYSHIFTTSLLGEFRFGYNRYRNQIAPWGDFSALNTLAGVNFPNGLPSINISGFSPLGLPANLPMKQIDNIYDGTTNWVAHTGMHSLKFGANIRDLQVNGIASPFFNQLGSFTFGAGGTLANSASADALTPAALQSNAFASFLLGAPTQAGITNFTQRPAYRQKHYSAYVTDTINLFQYVSLELGVRYDIYSPIEPDHPGGASLFDPTSNTLTDLGMNGVSSRAYRHDLNNVAPRIGLAIRPMDRLVFRAGYGILYFPTPYSLLPFTPAAQSIQTGIAGGTGITGFSTPTIPATNTTTAANTPFFTGPRDFRTPYLQTYSAMIQGDLGNSFLLDVGYVGNTGRQLPFSRVLAGLPGTGTQGLTPGRTAATFEIAPGTNSNYNSGQVNLTKRFAAGLSFSGAYTYSKTLDYGNSLIDPFNRRGNYGPADWDRQHMLALSHVWRLPFGVNRKYFQTGWGARALGDWEFTGILRWATGTPYTITADPLACACLGTTGVPAFFGPGVTGEQFSGVSNFDPSLFSTPAAGTFGSLNRNAFRGPDFFVYNVALFRNFAVNENIKLELRGEAYNITNRRNPMNPVTSLTAPGFGTSLGNLNGQAGRQFQVAGRLLF